jgi:hypothetical protein
MACPFGSSCAYYAVIAAALMAGSPCGLAEPVPVHQVEGEFHGFLVLRTLGGNIVAEGDVTQVVRAGKVTNRLTFRFKDGSVQDETVVFSQNHTFHLLSDHLIQSGPAFKRAINMSIDGVTGVVTVRSAGEDGKEKSTTDHLNLPPDLANGMVPMLLKNVAQNSSMTLSMVVATPKPRIVKLAISPDGEESFSIGDSSRKAMRYVVKLELGGVAGVVAPVVGKQPPDTHVWMILGTAPTFVKSEGPLAEGTDILQTELTSPVWVSAQKARDAQEKGASR